MRDVPLKSTYNFCTSRSDRRRKYSRVQFASRVLRTSQPRDSTSSTDFITRLENGGCVSLRDWKKNVTERNGQHVSPKRKKRIEIYSSHSNTPLLQHSNPPAEFMRKFFTLLSREVTSYFYSPIAYIVLLFFLIVSGVDFYFQISFMNQRPVPYSVQEAFFNSVFFWFAFVLIFPLITMRLFAEEFKLGTIEPLMTAPVRDWQVVLAKFFGALVFYLILWIPTLIYFWIFQAVTHQPAANSSGAYLGSYLMLLLLGMFYLSVGCLASVLTKNQIVAAVISFCVITLHFFSGLISFVLQEISSSTRRLLGYFSALEQMSTL